MNTIFRTFFWLLKYMSLIIFAPLGILLTVGQYTAAENANREYEVFQDLYVKHQEITLVGELQGNRQRKRIQNRLDQEEAKVCFGWTPKDETQLQREIKVTEQLYEQAEKTLDYELATTATRAHVVIELMETSVYASWLLEQLMFIDNTARVGEEACITQGKQA